jgi:hypothetical protein
MTTPRERLKETIADNWNDWQWVDGERMSGLTYGDARNLDALVGRAIAACELGVVTEDLRAALAALTTEDA